MGNKTHATVSKKGAKNFSRSRDVREDRGRRQTKFGSRKNAART